jgi:hypothetical protein
MNRRRHVVLSLCGGVLILLALPYMVWHPRRLNHGGFERIEISMTQQEVESLLGGPPGIYYPSYYCAGAGMSEEPLGINGAAEIVLWYDDQARYEIGFGDDGKVVGKHQRSIWYTTAYTSRHTALIHGVREPTPLKPRRYETDPSRILRGQP